jgi:signal transduction histidine kinase/DNA-binding response OmpR family regulator
MRTDDDKVNVLVVDDLPDKLLVYSAILEELGENLVLARSGAEALKLLLQQEFAVVLLDVNMPGIDGFETAALMRSRKKSAHTPVIFVTAFADEVHAAAGYALGAVDYMLTPVLPDVLRTKVRVFVDLFRMQQQARRHADERVAMAEERAMRMAAEASSRRSAFLAHASKVLMGSLQLEEHARDLATLLVPFLADLSVITRLDEHGQPCQLEWAWAGSQPEPRAQPASEETIAEPLLSAMHQAIASRTTVTLQAPCQAARAGSQPAPAPTFALTDFAAIPLVVRDKVFGAIALGMGPSGRDFEPEDLALAHELAAGAAVAIDNTQLYRNIQEADRRKDEFLAMLAHELRNPLAPIRNAVHLLSTQTGDPAAAAWSVDVIQRQVTHLVQLVDGLLDVSRITSGKIQLRGETVDLAAVVAVAVETSRPLIDSKQHALHVRLPPEPVPVHGDAARLAQIVANLLNNAAKYTDPGGRIELTVSREGQHAALRVRDTGVGISSDLIGHVFDLFTQGQRSLDRSQGGLGIGLTVVRTLVEMHGGRVAARSDGWGKGSEFEVVLPVVLALPAAPAKSRSPRTPAGPRRRVLIVDDNEDAATSLSKLLSMQGHDVRVAHCGISCLQLTREFEPEVVLLDLGLPGMDGYEVARALRANPPRRPVLVVALTGYGNEDDRKRTRAEGFYSHLVKPVDPEALRELLTALPIADSEPAQQAVRA